MKKRNTELLWEKESHSDRSKSDSDPILLGSDSRVFSGPSNRIQIEFLDLKLNRIRIRIFRHPIQIQSVVIPSPTHVNR